MPICTLEAQDRKDIQADRDQDRLGLEKTMVASILEKLRLKCCTIRARTARRASRSSTNRKNLSIYKSMAYNNLVLLFDFLAKATY